MLHTRLLWMKYRKISSKLLSNLYRENTRPIICTVGFENPKIEIHLGITFIKVYKHF